MPQLRVRIAIMKHLSDRSGTHARSRGNGIDVTRTSSWEGQRGARGPAERREGDAWRAIEHGPGGSIHLASIGAEISVDALYENPLPP